MVAAFIQGSAFENLSFLEYCKIDSKYEFSAESNVTNLYEIMQRIYSVIEDISRVTYALSYTMN